MLLWSSRLGTLLPVARVKLHAIAWRRMEILQPRFCRLEVHRHFAFIRLFDDVRQIAMVGEILTGDGVARMFRAGRSVIVPSVQSVPAQGGEALAESAFPLARGLNG